MNQKDLQEQSAGVGVVVIVLVIGRSSGGDTPNGVDRHCLPIQNRHCLPIQNYRWGLHCNFRGNIIEWKWKKGCMVDSVG